MQCVGSVVGQQCVLPAIDLELSLGDPVSTSPNDDTEVGAWLGFLHQLTIARSHINNTVIHAMMVCLIYHEDE